jgi:hypothetical protein
MSLTRKEAALVVLGWHASSDLPDAYDVVILGVLNTQAKSLMERCNVFQESSTSRIDEAL